MRGLLGRRLPAQDEPDGDVWAPHHWWVGIALMVAGFAYWQPQHDPATGALLAGVGLLIAADDYLSHAFGVWTPLDAAFRWAVFNTRVGRWYSRLYRTWRDVRR